MSKRTFETVEQGTHYRVPMYTVVDGKGIEPVLLTMDIEFVRGSKLVEEDVPKRTGTLHEHLLSVCIADLKYKSTLVPSRETALAITKLEEALFWIEERGRAREAAGTQGTYQK